MLLIEEMCHKDFELCFNLDSNSIALWSKKQWENELKKKDVKVFGISFSKTIIGVCVFQVVLDEAQIHYFAVNRKFQRRGFGSYFMKNVIERCKKLKINRLFLEVSKSNIEAEKFYNTFNFITVGIRKNYYKNGSDAILKEKKLIKN